MAILAIKIREKYGKWKNTPKMEITHELSEKEDGNNDDVKPDEDN